MEVFFFSVVVVVVVSEILLVTDDVHYDPAVWGACNHAFHLHCVLKWVNSQTSQAHCPMCRREWQFKD